MTSQSLREAIDKHTPGQGLLVHTDQGFHYQHASWRQLIASIDGIQSMSRKGNCYDNSVMENFFSHLKAEMFHGETFTNIDQFTQEIANYIHWYNNHRTQQDLRV